MLTAGTPRRLVVAGFACVTLAACSSSGSDAPDPTTVSSPPTSSSPRLSASTTPPATLGLTGPVVPAAPAAADVRAGLKGLTGFVFTGNRLAEDPGGNATIRGRVTLRGGVVTAFHAESTSFGGNDLQVTSVGGTTWVKLSDKRVRTSRPWLVLPRTSTDTVIASYLDEAALLRRLVSIDRADDLLLLAPEVRRDTLSSSGGTTVPRYFVGVDLTKLPASYPQLASLVALEAGPLLASVTLDAGGRPDNLVQQVGEFDQVTLAVDYDARATAVTAPPADQVTRTFDRVR